MTTKFSCKVCNKVIRDRSNYNKHLKTNTHRIKAGEDLKDINKVGRPQGAKSKTEKLVRCHKCSHCNYTTKNTGHYNNHIKKHTETS